MSALPTRVLVGRSESDAAPYLEVLRDHGVAAAALPLIRVRALAAEPAARTPLARLAEFSWALFASRNAVECFFAALGAHALPPTLRCGGVGPATKAALEAHGATVACTPAAGTGEALAEILLARGEDAAANPVLLVAARGGRTELQRALRAAGHHVERLELYESLPLAGPPPPAGAVVLLFSPSGCKALAARVAEPAARRVWAIGPTTAAAAEAAGFALERTLIDRSPDALRAALHQAQQA
ncbi:MAG TPA: uroporphyrinogen-III synthase [Planctomycetota bacterium]